MRTFLTAVSFFLLTGAVHAGPPPLLWSANFNPSTGGEETWCGAVTTAAGETHILYVMGSGRMKIGKYNASGVLIGTVSLEPAGIDMRNDLGLAMDASGNYVVGGRGHTSNDSDDLGAAKWSSAGTLLWASLHVTSGIDESGRSNGTGIDAAGNVYVIGYVNNGQQDTMLVKFDASGAYQWAVTTDGVNANSPYAFTVLPAGGAAYVSYFNSPLNASKIRSISGAGAQVFSATCYDYSALAWSGTAFIAARQVSGFQTQVDEVSAANGSWVRSSAAASPGSGGAYPAEVVVHPSGETFVSGQFGIPNGAVPFVSAFGPPQAGFPVRWSRSYDVGASEGGGNNSVFHITVDAGGTLYLSNGMPPMGIMVNNNSCGNGGDFVLRGVTPTTGAPLFRTVFDGPMEADARHMVSDAAGNFYLTTESPARLIKYDANGVLQWSRSYTSTAYCTSAFERVLTDATQVYVAFSGRISTTFCCLADDEDVLIARYSQSTGALNGIWTWTATADTNIGPMKFNSAGTALYLGYGDGSGGNGKLAALAAFNTTTGAVTWTRTLAPSIFESLQGLTLDGANNIYASFPTTNPTDSNAGMVTWMRKLDASGNEIWTRTSTSGSPLCLGLGTALATTGGGGIYVAGGEADTYPNPTFFHGFLQRFDFNGNLLWTRTNDGGQKALYFSVAVSAGGTPVVGGFVGPTMVFGEGINAGGQGDVILHAWDPDGAGCAAPLWGAQYDSGLGDESPQAIISTTTYTTMAVGTASGPVILNYGIGSSDAPVLDTRITVSPGPAEFNPSPAVVTISVTTTNTGGRGADAVTPVLLAVSGAANVSAILGPVPSTALGLTGGMTKTWRWSATVAGAGTVIFSVTVGGLDSCGGALVKTVKGATLTTGNRAVMGGAAGMTRFAIGVGDVTTMWLSITNSGIAGSAINSGSATAFQTGGLMTFTPPLATGVGALGSGAGATMAWSMTGTTSGVGTVSFQASWVDSLFGYAMPNNPSTFTVTVYDQARLQTFFVPGPQNTASVGQLIPIALTVSNTGGYPATGVSATLFLGPGAATLQLVSAPGSLTLPAHGSTVFMWTYNVVAPGALTATATATGLDSSPLAYALTSSTSISGVMQTPPVLSGRVMTYGPSTIEVGQSFLGTLTLTNSGQATAAITSNGNKIYDLGTTSTTVMVGPTPSLPSQLLGGQVVVMSFTLTAMTPGTLQFTGSLTGVDVNSSATIVSQPYPPSNVVTVVTAPVLAASLRVFRFGGTPTSLAGHVGQKFFATLTVTNTGGATANNVTPSALFAQFGSGTGNQVAGPTPAAGLSLASGAAVTFSWTFTGGAPGGLVLATTVTGTSALTGNGTSSGPAVSNGYAVMQLLTSSLSLSTPSVNGGQVCVVSMTVTNTGTDIVTAIDPELRLSPSASATTNGAPVIPSVTLNPGQAETITWNLVGLDAGDVAVTAYVDGIDASDSTVPVSTTTTGLVTVTGTLSSRVVLVPAAVKEGQTFEVRFTVTKNGSSTIQNLTPSILLANPALASVESGPAPAVVAFLTSAGPHPTFVWTLRALKSGSLGIQVTASGNIISPPGPDSTQANATVTIAPAISVPEFDGQAIVFPNPVTGDAMQIAVKLEAWMKEVHIEIYNSGFQRVYHGDWTGLSGAATLLDIQGISAWAPGAYFIRMTRSAADGGSAQAVTGTIRFRIKRTGVTP